MTSLSNSVLWQRMHDYYDHMGPEVWEEEVVPSHITSNTFLANRYAQLIIAQIQDSLKNQPLDEPFYILEIGAGHGKLSYLLLQFLTKALEIYQLPAKTIRYIMTDISDKSLAFWQAHPALKPFVDMGVLDFAKFDAIKGTTLEMTQQTLQHGDCHNPLFVINNYIFDTLPHDAFQVINSQLHETELCLEDNGVDIQHYFKDKSYQFKNNAISTDYYANNAALNDILAFYQQYFDNASFLIPIGAIQSIENIQKFTHGPLMLLVADKGETQLDLFSACDNPDISFHGSVSMNVNFDAIARYAKAHDGISLFMDNTNTEFQVTSFIFNAKYPMPQTQYTFKSALANFSPHDLFALCYHNDEPNTSFSSLDEILSLMNLAEWDPSIFFYYYELILNFLEKNEYNHEHELTLKNGLKAVWTFFFKLEKNQDIPFAIGTILYQIDEFEQALFYYQQSLEHFGESPDTLYNMALAYQLMEDEANKAQFAKRLADIDPNYPGLDDLIR